MNPVQGYFSLRLMEKLKEYAEKLEGSPETKTYVAGSRFGRFWFISLPIGIAIWGLYLYFVIYIISNGPSDVITFLLFVPFVLLLIYLVFLLLSKKMVLVYSWKEFIYYPLIGCLYLFALGGSYAAVSFLSENHQTLAILITVALFVIPTTWLLVLFVRTVFVNKRHPFMGFILGLLKLIIWLIVWLQASSRNNNKESKKRVS